MSYGRVFKAMSPGFGRRRKNAMKSRASLVVVPMEDEVAVSKEQDKSCKLICTDFKMDVSGIVSPATVLLTAISEGTGADKRLGTSGYLVSSRLKGRVYMDAPVPVGHAVVRMLVVRDKGVDLRSNGSILSSQRSGSRFEILYSKDVELCAGIQHDFVIDEFVDMKGSVISWKGSTSSVSDVGMGHLLLYVSVSIKGGVTPSRIYVECTHCTSFVDN